MFLPLAFMNLINFRFEFMGIKKTKNNSNIVDFNMVLEFEFNIRANDGIIPNRNNEFMAPKSFIINTDRNTPRLAPVRSKKYSFPLSLL